MAKKKLRRKCALITRVRSVLSPLRMSLPRQNSNGIVEVENGEDKLERDYSFDSTTHECMAVSHRQG